VVADLLFGFGVLGLAVLAGVVFLAYEARQQRLLDEAFRRELEDLRQQYRNE
jgi:hypothetical protein